MSARRLPILLAAALALALTAAGVHAEPAGLRGAPSGLEPPAVVVAGEQHTLEWTAPAGVIELELEISLDDGRSWSRLSPELHGAVESWTWRVPRTPSERARLRVRVGTEHGEYDLEPSESFRIELPAGEELPPAWHPHAWRGHAALPGNFGRARERLSPAAELLAAETTPRVARLDSAPVEAVRLVAPRSATLPIRSGSVVRAPRFVPMRN